MAQSHDAAGPSSPPAPRTRKPGEVRSRSGCATCKQRRKKCDEDFRIRHNGATSCNRCADRGIHCELSSNATPQRATPQQQRQRPSPYPTSGAPEASSRAVRGTSAANTAHHTDVSSAASTSAAPLGSAALDAATNPYASILDPTQSWNASAHFPLQQQPQQPLPTVATFQSLQNPAVANQLAWMSQNSTVLNRSAVRYNRPNIWPVGSSNGAVDPATAVAGIPSTAGNLAAPTNAVDMNALFNMLNNNAATVPAAPNTSQWNQGYTNSMDNIMLDDFVNELMSLTGPLVGGEGSTTASQTTGNTPSAAVHASSPFQSRNASVSAQDSSHVSTSASGAQKQNGIGAASSAAAHTTPAVSSSDPSAPSAQPKSGNGKATTPARASNRYRKLLDSDAIESLLSKYSPIYERFWHATLMLLSNKKRQAAVDYLMSVIRSNKACRASVVVVCLAYHELVQRVKTDAQKADPKQPAQQPKNAPPSWTTLATDTVHNDKAASKPSGEGISQTVISMLPGDDDDDEDDDDSQSIRSDVAEDSNDEEMPHSRMYDDDDADDEDDEPEEQISTIERRPSGERSSYLSPHSKVSSERYGSTSFSRSSDTAGRSPHPPARTLTGKLSTVEDKIQEMADPSHDPFKDQKVEENTVELWFDIAQAELQRSRDELTLDQELCAIINLRWACLCFAGAERARQLTEELGKVMQREGIDMDDAREEEKKGSFVSVMLLTAVYTDVLDTVSDRGKRTHVAIRDASKRKSSQLSKLRRTSSLAGGEAGSPTKDEPFFGRISLVSLELLTCFKLISDLSADVWGPISSSVTQPSRPSEEEVAERSREIERKVMSLPPWTDPNTSSSLRVRAFALQEIWRQTARLYLLQAVHRRGPLHPELQNILHEIIRLAKMMKIQSFSSVAPAFTDIRSNSATAAQPRSAPTNYIGGLRADDPTDNVRDANHPDPIINATFGMEDLETEPPSMNEDDAAAGPAPFQMWLDVASWEMCTVWFLCSTVALTRADRQFCIHHLESLGLERANRDNIQVVRDYWAKMDSSGHTVDWFDFVKGAGRSVIFAF